MTATEATHTPPSTPGAPSLGKWAATQRQAQRVWAHAKPYFTESDERWKALLLLASVVALNLALVYMNVLFNDWNKLFYDALQDKNAAVFWTQLGRFTYLAFIFIVIAVYKFYLTQLLEMRWRAWMTGHYLERWLSNQVAYRLELARFAKSSPSGQPDNPDQRIQEDISQFTSLTIGLSMGLLNSVVTLLSFVGILWSLSGSFAFSLQGNDYTLPGFMVWMALIYCIAGSLITHAIGHPQIALNFQQQKVEAEFRHRMVRVREYSESIALDRGEAVERERVSERFSAVLANYLALIRAQKRLVWFTSFFGQAAVVFPFVVAAPRFFSGAIQLGDLMQISSAFGQVQGALSWLVDNYSSLASWRATTDRLTSFEESFAAITPPAYVASVAPAESAKADSIAVMAEGLEVALPDGDVLFSGVQLQAAAGDHILVQGPSGSGKSTLFRALAGIWPYAKGQVRLAPGVMFLPQRPYLPDGTLRAALTYPGHAQRWDDAHLKNALQEAALPQLADQLDVTAAWSQTLSGGEQQRLAIARALLHQPRWLFADEATSALDEATEALMYQRLRAMLQAKHGALISIAHRPGVAAFHEKRWTFTPYAPASGAMPGTAARMHLQT